LERLDTRDARRLALARAGLLKPAWTGLPSRAPRRGARAVQAALAVIDRFGYLQLDTVSIAGARSHAIVLLSRLDGLEATVGESLLAPEAPIFEYWGHEASWIPMSLYPYFAFRRRAFRSHPWWGNIIGEHPGVARQLRRRIRTEGALRSVDMEGPGGRGWWDFKIAKRVATALWSSGELAIRERVNFQRTYDLADRVIPDGARRSRPSFAASLPVLLLKALEGHGWATTGTLAQTWRLRNCRADLDRALARLVRDGAIVECALADADGRATRGWIRAADLELVDRLRRVRPRADRGVLLSPFDPLLWDRLRVRQLFGFDQVLEIFKPAPKRIYGYYCMPVLAGERLIARFDFKADRKRGALDVLSARFESARPSAADRHAADVALGRYAGALGLEPAGWRPR